MAKILLVEDDTNLREIFEMRLQAEGYETLTADNGEQALTIAMKDKPDLIIADVMMPHLSGFEMVETLRAAPGMADTKVIMMTALGQAEDQARGEKLGVVKYLVKSQVTLEDFARVVREVLPPGDQGAKPNNQESENKMPDDPMTPQTTPPASDNPISGAPVDDTAAAGQMSTADAQAGMNQQVDDAMAAPAATPAPVDGAPASEEPAPMPAPEMPAAPAPVEPTPEGETPPAMPPADSSSAL